MFEPEERKSSARDLTLREPDDVPPEDIGDNLTPGWRIK
jgi:hypothetical protein